MRIPINLASQPLENLRPVRTAVILAALAAVVLGAVIVRREMRSRNEFLSLIQQQQRLEAGLQNLAAEQGELESWLATTQVQQIRERSGFLNSLIVRKSLSWTQLFMDLEETLPPRARITAIHPSLDASEDVKLELTVAAASMEPLVEFLKNLESSPEFGAPAVGAQRYVSDRSSGSGISLDLTTQYRQTRSRNSTGNSETDIAAAASQTASAAEEETR